MVSRFILGDEVQGFNPISEAKDVVTDGNDSVASCAQEVDDITKVGGINLTLLNQEDPDQGPLEVDSLKKKSVKIV
jgi:hypothetical protein